MVKVCAQSAESTLPTCQWLVAGEASPLYSPPTLMTSALTVVMGRFEFWAHVGNYFFPVIAIALSPTTDTIHF
jgi:hypothetical protein